MKGFLGSGALEVAIGASFAYLVLASFCSTANEWISSLLNARADTLHQTMRELLDRQNIHDGRDFLRAFYEHPVITAIVPRAGHTGFIPSRAFATAVLDLATLNVHGCITFQTLETNLATLPAGRVKTALQALIQNAAGDLNRAEANIEGWFNDAMSRASAHYKRRTRLWTLAVASAVTVIANADSLAMFGAHAGLTPGCLISGWSASALHAGRLEWLSRVTGWCLTIAAVSLGAPFWFDLFNRFLSFRTGERRPSP